ncbi:MAG: hypothetical protein K9W45_10655 [Candidatus Heimdallarchaeum aukensis]|uniref:Uncharacterized protein n=1 Tax=Candidatus Heimdallarchaeum aukensis TaxID=2876573 RepID=A0A9Y1FK22_9ARCH|nr:MAG: hypothetical protein K9W45_10655 [Candidatus Heimdallarchaeum aukensis]
MKYKKSCTTRKRALNTVKLFQKDLDKNSFEISDREKHITWITEKTMTEEKGIEKIFSNIILEKLTSN